jgi:hypothetical protein
MKTIVIIQPLLKPHSFAVWSIGGAFMRYRGILSFSEIKASLLATEGPCEVVLR